MKNITNQKNYEVREVYYLIFTNEIKRGALKADATSKAYELVTQFFQISEKTVRNILTKSSRISPEMKNKCRESFIQRISTINIVVKIIHDEINKRDM